VFLFFCWFFNPRLRFDRHSIENGFVCTYIYIYILLGGISGSPCFAFWVVGRYSSFGLFGAVSDSYDEQQGSGVFVCGPSSYVVFFDYGDVSRCVWFSGVFSAPYLDGSFDRRIAVLW
jgi:hypothetical protein